MWISKTIWNLVVEWKGAAAENAVHRNLAEQQVAALTAENAQLRSQLGQTAATLEWAKHRLNQVEKERAQLISAAIGVKLAVPEFLPARGAEDEGRALHELPDLSTVGGDALESGGPNVPPELAGLLGTEKGVDFSMMPGYRS